VRQRFNSLLEGLFRGQMQVLLASIRANLLEKALPDIADGGIETLRKYRRLRILDSSLKSYAHCILAVARCPSCVNICTAATVVVFVVH
jgi:hypothetical protein